MVLDLSKYRTATLPDIERWVKYRADWTLKEHLKLLPNYTQCHIVAILYYLGELSGFTNEINTTITYLTAWYHITEVVGKLDPSHGVVKNEE